MSAWFPEQPVLFYPSLARRFGTDEALLLAIYHQFAHHHGGAEVDGARGFIVRRGEWLALAPFWDEERLAATTNSLVAQGVIEAEFQPNRSLRVRLLEPPESAPPAPAGIPIVQMPAVPERKAVDRPAAAREGVTERPPLSGVPRGMVPLRERPSFPRTPPPGSSTLLARGPAPSFGGSTGWQRPKDDLERLFEQQEQRNRQLHPMSPDWQPSATVQQMLAKQSIPAEFSHSCIDEFVAYWLERDRKEASWDHLFIRLVKKEWVKAQGRKAREARLSDDTTTEASGERYQADSRAQRRERITDAVMDIHNTDW